MNKKNTHTQILIQEKILPFRDPKTETNETSTEQFLFQKQSSLLPGMYRAIIDLIFDSDILKVQRLLILLNSLLRRCSQYEKTADNDDNGGNSAMHLSS